MIFSNYEVEKGGKCYRFTSNVLDYVSQQEKNILTHMLYLSCSIYHPIWIFFPYMEDLLTMGLIVLLHQNQTGINTIKVLSGNYRREENIKGIEVIFQLLNSPNRPKRHFFHSVFGNEKTFLDTKIYFIKLISPYRLVSVAVQSQGAAVFIIGNIITRSPLSPLPLLSIVSTCLL